MVVSTLEKFAKSELALQRVLHASLGFLLVQNLTWVLHRWVALSSIFYVTSRVVEVCPFAVVLRVFHINPYCSVCGVGPTNGLVSVFISNLCETLFPELA